MQGAGTVPATRPPASDTAAILAALDRIERRLDRVEALASTALAEGRGAIGIVTDTVDRQMAAAQARGVDVDARARAALALLERATEPRTLERLGHAVELAEQAPAALAIVTDTADRLIGRLQADGVDVDARLANLVRAAERLSSNEAIATLEATFGRIEQIRAVLESGILDPAAVAIVAKAGEALADAASEPPIQVGPLGLVRAIGEREVRAATGFLVRFARRLGAALERSDKQLPPTTPKERP